MFIIGKMIHIIVISLFIENSQIDISKIIPTIFLELPGQIWKYKRICFEIFFWTVLEREKGLV